MISRLKKLAMSINDFPVVLTANDVKMELISQFDWFTDTSKEQLEQVIESTPAVEFAQIAQDINDDIIPLAMDNYVIKSLYTKEFSIELRWLLARALYVDKFSINVNLINQKQPADPQVFNHALLFSNSLYTPERLRRLQDRGFISFANEQDTKPLDEISNGLLDRMIREAHEVAIVRVLTRYPITQQILYRLAEDRLNIYTNEFWINKNIR